jgi:putative peptide zinc metalloprotease protein
MSAGRLGDRDDRATVMEAAATAAGVGGGVGGGVAGSSRVRLRTLSQRRDRDGWVIGRPETGDFISIPDVAHRVITLLGERLTVDEVSARLRAETGTRFGVADFVAALDELGFVGSVDDLPREDHADNRPSLPWLRQEHVRWLLHPLAPIVVAGFAGAGVTMLALHPALLPSYHVLVWSRRVGLVLAVNAAIGWTLVLLHELAHLATARAAGAPSRITLSTRLQFLVAQTDVSGVWAAPRRSRITVYLAGIAANVCLAGACLLVLGLANPHGIPRSLLAVGVTETVLMLATQLMVFMRTDLYFVLQDLTGCANLYADGSAYLRYLGRTTRHSTSATDPSLAYPATERRAIRLYSAVLLAGTAICLGVECAVSVPALIVLLVRAVSEIGVTPVTTLDGSAALTILLTWQALWARRWWQRHRRQMQALARKIFAGERR